MKLDIRAEDAEGRIIDIEIQRADRGTGVRRARFHSSMIDRTLLEKGDDFEQLPDSYIIFITENDKFHKGLPLYHIERKITELDDIPFDDGTHIIYVNGAFRDVSHPIGRLMHDFNCSNPNDMYYPELAEKARYFKETEKGLTNMGDVFEKFVAKREKEAVEKAAQEKNIEFAKGLLADGMSIEFTVRHSKLSEAEVRELASKLTA